MMMDAPSAAQQAAILAFFRVAADHELTAENLRCRLCEAHDFDPYEAFKTLQGAWHNQKGWVSAMDLRSWLSTQPHHLATSPLEEIAAMITPFVTSHGELRYEGFLRMTLPKEPLNAWLKEVCLARGSQASFSGHERESRMRPEVAHRLCQLFENEMDMNRNLKFHRKRFHELGVRKDAVLSFLEAEQGVRSPGVRGLLSPAVVRRVLVDRMQALTSAQCDALLRRINPTGVCLAALDDLTLYLSPPTPSMTPFSTAAPNGREDIHGACSRSLQASRDMDRYTLRDREASRERDTYYAARERDAREREASRDADYYALRDREASRDRWSSYLSDVAPPYGGHFGSGLNGCNGHGRALGGAPPRLQEPTGGRPLEAPMSPRTPRRSGRTLSPVTGRNSFVSFASPETTLRPSGANGAHGGHGVNGVHGHAGPMLEESSPHLGPPTPLPPFLWKDNSSLSDSYVKARCAGGNGGGGAAAALPWSPRAWTRPTGGSLSYRSRGFAEETSGRESSPSRYGGGSLTARGRGRTSRDAAVGRKASVSAERRPLASSTLSTQASTLDLSSPRSPRSVRFGWGTSPTGHSTSARPQDPGFTQRRAGSLPAGSREVPGTSPYASPAKLPLYPSAWSTEKKGQLVKSVLRLMAAQAEADARVESAKALLPPGCTLEAVFASLDRHQKGYITDTDLWQVAQDFGGQTPFSALVALVQEVQLRQPRCKAFIPGRLSLRETGTLILPVGSYEFQALQEAASDAEARSVLYLLRNSEPCPTCGIRVQRSGDCAGCPNVRCTVCGTSFRCFCVVSDYGAYGAAVAADGQLSVTSRYHVYQLVDAAGRAAEELERDRRQLSATSGYDLSALSDVFNHLAGGRLSSDFTELRLALSDVGVRLTEQEIDMLWHRYAPQGGTEVTFPDFARQIKPRLAGLHA